MIRLAIFGAALGLVSTVFGQYNSYGYYTTTPIQMSINQTNWHNMAQWNNLAVELRRRGYSDDDIKDLSFEQMQALVGKGTKPSKPGSAPAKAAKPAPPKPSATRFTPSGKRETMNAVINALTTDDDQKAGLKTLFSAGIKAFEDAAKAAKLQNDLAAAMAYFVIAAYALEGENISDKASNLLAYGLQDTFNTPAMGKTTSAEKEAFSEFLVVMGTFLLASKEQLDPREDAETLSALRATARDVLKKFLELDIKQYKLTETGLAKR